MVLDNAGLGIGSDLEMFIFLSTRDVRGPGEKKLLEFRVEITPELALVLVFKSLYEIGINL